MNKSFSQLVKFVKKASPKKQIGMLLLASLILALPFTVWTVGQRVLYQGKAEFNQPVTPPIDPAEVISFQVQPGQALGEWINLKLHLNTNDIAVDGMQLVAYLKDNPNIEAIRPSQSFAINSELGKHFKVVDNSVQYSREKKQYKIVLGLITRHPKEPFAGEIEVGSLSIIPNSTSGEVIDPKGTSLSFDASKTKVIAHQNGRDLATYLPNVTIPFHPFPPTSPTPPTPTPPTPPSPTPPTSPSPSPTYNTGLDFSFNLQGYDQSAADRGIMPKAEFAIWDEATGQKIRVMRSDFKYEPGTEGFRLSTYFRLEKATAVGIYVKSDKHQVLVYRGLDIMPGDHPGAALLGHKYAAKAGEINGDHIIDLEDYHQFVREFAPAEFQPNAKADLNYDGMVDIDDYVYLVLNFDPDYEILDLPSGSEIARPTTSPSPYWPPGTPLPASAGSPSGSLL